MTSILVILAIFVGFQFLLWIEPAQFVLSETAVVLREPRWSWYLLVPAIAIIYFPVWVILYVVSLVLPSQQRVLMTYYNVALLVFAFDDTQRGVNLYYYACSFMVQFWDAKYTSPGQPYRRAPLVMHRDMAPTVWRLTLRTSVPSADAIASYEECVVDR